MAPSPSTQLNQILGDGPLLNAMKKGGAKGADALLGDNLTQGDIFRNLLSGLTKTSGKNDLSALVTKAAAAKKPADATLQVTPEFLNLLKTLTPDELNKMPPEMAALIVKQLQASGELDSKMADLMQTLSAIAAGTDQTPDLYEIINDPKLAAFLDGLPHAQTIDNSALPVTPLTAVFTIVPAAPVKTATAFPANAVVLDESGDVEKLSLLPGNTITIADLDADGFQALKKLAFADIAPYLTMPRTVRFDNGSVMKIAQGPSFLNEDTTQAALMAAIAGLASTTPQNLGTPSAPSIPTQLVADADAPIFLDASILAGAQAQNQSAQKPVKPADFFAALLGAHGSASNDAATAQTPFVATGEAKTAAQPTANALLQAASQHSTAPQQAAVQQLVEAFKAGEHITSTFNNSSADDFATALHLNSDTSLPSAATNALTTARSAATPHPATHMVSVALQRMSGGEAENQITINLEPGSLGKIKITLEFGEDKSIKAKLLAERPETISLLQKDAAHLERALQNSGFDSKTSTLTFDLANGDTFSGAMNGQQQGGQNGGSERKSDDGTDFATIETVLPIYVDPQTGLTHVNVVV